MRLILLFTVSADLSREELLKIVEQQTAELEASTVKKANYKTKYLDEKQRAATMSDYYKGEIERYSRELELARSTIDVYFQYYIYPSNATEYSDSLTSIISRLRFWEDSRVGGVTSAAVR